MTTPDRYEGQRRSADPEEGVDYVVDLYAVLGLDPTATDDDIKSRIKEMIVQNHPDRLQGMDAAIVATGERNTLMATKAKEILLSPDKRAEYDGILQTWEGLVSTNGMAVDSVEAWNVRKARTLSHEELEADFSKTRKQIEQQTGHMPGLVELLEKTVDALGDNVDDETRAQYDAALRRQDSVLAIEQSMRAGNVGMGDKVAIAAYGHLEEIESGIESGREMIVEKHRAIEAANVRGRLALLAGADIEQPQGGAILPVENVTALPSWFDAQAGEVLRLAKEREAILEKRLANMKLEYPEAELQQDAKDAFIIGLDLSARHLWLGFTFDAEQSNAAQIDLDGQTALQLEAEDFTSVIGSGYNVLKVKPLDEIDIQTVLEAAISRHVANYDLAD